MSAHSFIAPPVSPVMAMMPTPISFATSNALRMFLELPEVEMPTMTSPALAVPRRSREKMRS